MNRRAQLVLAAAAVAAMALVPVVAAYLQMGYAGDVRATERRADPGEDARRVLERAVHRAAAGVPANRSWADRDDAVEEVRRRLGPPLRTLETARVDAGTAYAVSFNATAAREWVAENCPRGPGRRFGACEATRGVAVQERVGRTHVLAVAFDVRAATPNGRLALTVVVEVGG